MSSFFGSMSRRLTSSTTSGREERQHRRCSIDLSKTTSKNPSSKDARPRPRPLSDAEKLMQRLGVPEKEAYWFELVHDAIRRYVNIRSGSSSFNFQHIQRVVENARQLWNAEKHHSWAKNIDPLTIFIGVMASDISNDDTYALQVIKNGGAERNLQADDDKRQQQVDVVWDFLRQRKCPPAVAGPASHFAALVSFPREMNDLKGILGQCEAYPALRIVQDAVRLDDLGDTGIKRAHRLHQGRAPSEMTVVKLIDERFKYYPGLMKTKTGEAEAERLWAEMLQYKNSLWDYKRNRWSFM